MFSMAMWMAVLVAPLQLIVGDLHGLNTLEHQPAKIAAMEGHWEPQDGAPLILFGLPNMAAAKSTTRLRCRSSVAYPDALAGRTVAGLNTGRANELAAGCDLVLVVPDHGRDGTADDWPACSAC